MTRRWCPSFCRDSPRWSRSGELPVPWPPFPHQPSRRGSLERSPHPVFQRFAVRPTRSSSWPPSSCRTTRSGRTEHAPKGQREGDWRRRCLGRRPPARASFPLLSRPAAIPLCPRRQRRVKCCVHWHLVGAGSVRVSTYDLRAGRPLRPRCMFECAGKGQREKLLFKVALLST